MERSKYTIETFRFEKRFLGRSTLRLTVEGKELHIYHSSWQFLTYRHSSPLLPSCQIGTQMALKPKRSSQEGGAGSAVPNLVVST
jgi:hypothetical protein